VVGSNLDIEMLSILLQWMVAEHPAVSVHTHVTCWYDNMPTVVWEASKLLSSKAKTSSTTTQNSCASHLACQALPPITFHVSGKSNSMANFASRSFN